MQLLFVSLFHLNYTMYYYKQFKSGFCRAYNLFKLHNVLLQACYCLLPINSSIFSYNLSTINFILFFSGFIFARIINFPFLLNFINLSNLKHLTATPVRQISYQVHILQNTNSPSLSTNTFSPSKAVIPDVYKTSVFFQFLMNF